MIDSGSSSYLCHFYAANANLCSNFFILAEALRIPVVVHAGHSIMGTTASHELDPIGSLCSLYPNLPVILGNALG